MKKLFILAALLAAFVSLPASAERVQGGNFTLAGTADAAVDTQPGDLLGIFVSSSTSCTITFYNHSNALDATKVLVPTFSASAATWYPLPFRYSSKLYLDVGGTCAYAISYYH